MPDFGIMRGFNEKLFGDKLVAGQLPTQLGLIGSSDFGFDVDAQAFFDRVTAAGGTLSATEQLAVDTLVKQMKLDGTWTPMKAIYPMVGASAAACAQNLKSSSFTGSFSSGWTFASTGVKGNGTSAFMNTQLNLTTVLTANNRSSSFYSRDNTTYLNSQVDLGCTDSTEHRLSAHLNVFGINGFLRFSTGGGIQNTTTQRYDGFFVGSRIPSSVKLFRSNLLIGSYTTANLDIPNQNVYVGASNTAGVATSFTQREYAFASVGDGLTDTEASNFYTAVQAFQTTLSRQV